MALDTSGILRELKEERDRLDTAIAALEGPGKSANGRRRGVRPKAGNGRRKGARKGRRFSAAARKRISEAAKARWAAAKKAGRSAL